MLKFHHRSIFPPSFSKIIKQAHVSDCVYVASTTGSKCLYSLEALARDRKTWEITGRASRHYRFINSTLANQRWTGLKKCLHNTNGLPALASLARWSHWSHLMYQCKSAIAHLGFSIVLR